MGDYVNTYNVSLRRVVLAACAACLVFMQVTFGYYGTLPLNLGTAAALGGVGVMLATGIARINRVVIALSLVVLCYTILIGIFSANDYIEFIKSFVQICVLCSALVVATGVRVDVSAARAVSAACIVLLAGVATVIIAQSVLWNMFDSHLLVTPLGSMSPLGPGGKAPYQPFTVAIYQRPNGIYSEPSIAGWMMCFGLAVTMTAYKNRWVQRRRSSLLQTIFVLAALATGSITALVGLILVICANVISSLRRHDGGGGAVVKWVGVSVCCIFIIFLAFGAVLSHRVSNALKPGTSIYFRLVAPTLLIRDSLVDSPFGHAVGNVDYIKSKSRYMVNWSGGNDTHIDNSAFLIIYYYGIVGLVAVIAVLAMTFRSIWRGKNNSEIAISMVIAALATGALWSAWFSLFLLIGVYIMRCRDENMCVRRLPRPTIRCQSSNPM